MLTLLTILSAIQMSVQNAQVASQTEVLESSEKNTAANVSNSNICGLC